MSLQTTHRLLSGVTACKPIMLPILTTGCAVKARPPVHCNWDGIPAVEDLLQVREVKRNVQKMFGILYGWF